MGMYKTPLLLLNRSWSLDNRFSDQILFIENDFILLIGFLAVLTTLCLDLYQLIILHCLLYRW